MLHLIARDATNTGPSRGNQVIIAGSVLIAIATLGLCARLVSARMKKRSLNAADILLLFSFSLNVFETGMIMWATQHGGLGYHAETVPPIQLVNYAKMFLTASLVQPAILMSAKMSVLLLLYKIFSVRSFRIIISIFMFVVVAWWISLTITTFLICTPFDSNWGASPANCGNFHAVNVYAPIPWIVTDFGILFVPMPMIRKLHLPGRQRVALAGLFLIGGLTCVISCIRFRYVFFSFQDVTWETVPLAIWQLAESNVTILCASLIASRPVAMYLMPEGLVQRIRSTITTMRGSRGSSSGTTGGAGLSPQTTRDTLNTIPSRNNNVIKKNSSVTLQSVPKQMAQVHTIGKRGPGSEGFVGLSEPTYSVSVQGGSSRSREASDDSLQTGARVSESSTLQVV